MIVTAIDERFLPGLKALNNSIKRHSPDTPLVCMTYGDDELAEQASHYCDKVMHNFSIADYLPAGEGTEENCKPMYARLIVPMLFDECIWMDADQITQTDLSPLFDLGFKAPIAAVKAPYDIQRSVIGMKTNNAPAIFSGLMVFNVPEWRRLKLTERCFEIMKAPNVRFRFVVQSVLNIALDGNFFYLAPEWQGFANRKTFRPDGYRVLHWHGRGDKPWTNPNMPNADVWRRYA
jgi:lipopolysaccharide biosynthesis glycosyltransferase